ncbi:hypothetical protein [Gordonia sputi]
MSDPLSAPTRQWQHAAPELPELTTTAADVAERLLLMTHYNVDWDSWVGEHRRRYWDDVLPSRVHAATMRADSLATWWSLLSRSLPITVVDRARRLELVQLLAEPSPPVLAVLRDQLPALLLRVRIIAENVAAQRKKAQASEVEQP